MFTLHTTKAALGSVLALLCLARPVVATSVFASMGTDFWLAFTQNEGDAFHNFSPSPLSVFITSVTGATGAINSPGLALSIPFTVAPNGYVQISITASAALGDTSSAELVEYKGIEVSSDNPVAVYGMNHVQATSDGFSALPDALLGTDYYVLGYQGDGGSVYGASVGVVALQNGTILTVTPPFAFNGHAANAPYTVPLNQGQTYFMGAFSAPSLDFSGTRIQANQAIAVYGGAMFTNVPSSGLPGDMIVEELFPTNLWGQNYLSVPLATRSGGDTFRVLASQNGTSVSVNGVSMANLNQGGFVELTISASSQIQANYPVLVAQYSNSSSYDMQPLADDSEMQLQPTDRYCNQYVLAPDNEVGGSSFFDISFFGLVAPAAAVGAVTINGITIPAASFSPIASSGYSAATVAVYPPGGGSGYVFGSVSATCSVCVVQSPLPIGVSVYGFNGSPDAYSYPGGMALTPVTPTSTPTATAASAATSGPTLLLTPHDPNPNPSGSGIWIPYSINTDARVDFKIYDVAGELVRTLGPDDESAGTHEGLWDLRNASGAEAAPGIYLVLIHARSAVGDEAKAWKKCAVVR